MQEIDITEQTAGGRLDKLLLRYLDKAGSGFVYKMLRKKNIVLNDKKAQGNEKLSPGDTIKLYLADDTIAAFQSQSSAPEPFCDFSRMILFEDENLLVFSKPAGILSQKAKPGDLSMNDLLLSYLGTTSLFTPGISNRLDRNTSGILFAGKNPQASRLLNEAVRERQLKKLYLCLVQGQMTGARTLTGYLRKDKQSNQVFLRNSLSSSDNPNDYAKIETSYRVLSSNDQVSLLQVDLITGKTHQIRAHLSSIGHPLAGDSKYGDSFCNQQFWNRYRLTHQLLHAYLLRFENMQGILSYLNGTKIHCPLPEQFQQICEGEKLCLHGDPED